MAPATNLTIETSFTGDEESIDSEFSEDDCMYTEMFERLIAHCNEQLHSSDDSAILCDSVSVIGIGYLVVDVQKVTLADNYVTEEPAPSLVQLYYLCTVDAAGPATQMAYWIAITDSVLSPDEEHSKRYHALYPTLTNVVAFAESITQHQPFHDYKIVEISERFLQNESADCRILAPTVKELSQAIQSAHNAVHVFTDHGEENTLQGAWSEPLSASVHLRCPLHDDQDPIYQDFPHKIIRTRRERPEFENMVLNDIPFQAAYKLSAFAELESTLLINQPGYVAYRVFGMRSILVNDISNSNFKYYTECLVALQITQDEDKPLNVGRMSHRLVWVSIHEVRCDLVFEYLIDAMDYLKDVDTIMYSTEIFTCQNTQYSQEEHVLTPNCEANFYELYLFAKTYYREIDLENLQISFKEAGEETVDLRSLRCEVPQAFRYPSELFNTFPELEAMTEDMDVDWQTTYEEVPWWELSELQYYSKYLTDKRKGTTRHDSGSESRSNDLITVDDNGSDIDATSFNALSLHSYSDSSDSEISPRSSTSSNDYDGETRP